MSCFRTLAFAVCALGATGLSALAQSAPPAASPSPHRTADGRLSPHETVSKVIGGDRITIVYGRPYTVSPVTGESRTVWGGQLVPLGQIWRTGADEATLLITQKPIILGAGPAALRLPAGAYSLYTYPASLEDVKLVVNRQIGQWGTQYDASQDVGRVTLVKSPLAPAAHQFRITLAKTGAKTGAIVLAWEDTQFSLPVAVASSP